MTARRRTREADILRATRVLFDERGVRDAGIEDVSRAAGVNRAIIYRHFTGKEELFALVLVSYVDDLLAVVEALPDEGDAAERLTAFADAFLGFCLRYPAFIDCAMEMLRLPGTELQGRVSDEAMRRMGRAVGSALRHAVALLRAGDAAGEFAVDDPDLTANALYVQVLGLAHLARSGTGVEGLPGGDVRFFAVDEAGVRGSVRGLVHAMLRPTANAAG
ncbi:TetR/AcrR family transcriptional regulator [Patulibacter sp. SYSU D01012]|uniref:TetR/AcrR family transcriptional regulator n=1 Tax=Patulibacter sp. SYSU D01012 TaxID=2817381 RepID=UPI001B302D1B|nr:TetR/AcrR family transcriptional regulator [Patulibacter sp. SYSU D01012]